MADKKHLELLLRSVEKFNLFRKNNPNIYVDLTRASLTGADLTGANLTRAKYSLLMILRIRLGELSNSLTLELMRWDALVSGTDKMTAWAKQGGPCPFGDTTYLRLFDFIEKKTVWKNGPPQKKHPEVMASHSARKNDKNLMRRRSLFLLELVDFCNFYVIMLISWYIE